jgi:hypothetical protein
LADLPRKNCWTLAEYVGDRDPHGMQHLPARASWDTDGGRDDGVTTVIDALGDTDGPPPYASRPLPKRVRAMLVKPGTKATAMPGAPPPRQPSDLSQVLASARPAIACRQRIR